jgi:hypothetical protein
LGSEFHAQPRELRGGLFGPYGLPRSSKSLPRNLIKSQPRELFGRPEIPRGVTALSQIEVLAAISRFAVIASGALPENSSCAENRCNRLKSRRRFRYHCAPVDCGVGWAAEAIDAVFAPRGLTAIPRGLNRVLNADI